MIENEEERIELNETFNLNEEVLKLSFSRISDYSANGARALIQRRELSGQGILMGSLVDDWLFDNGNFKDKYFIFDGNKPTATLGKLVDIVLENYIEKPNNDELLNICKNNEFWKRSKDETIIANFDTEEFHNYVDTMFDSKGKTIIGMNDYIQALDIANTLRLHQYSKDYMQPKEGQQHIYQHEFNYELNKKVLLRGFIDIIIIDHNEQTIQFVDLKTGAPSADQFIFSFVSYRYYYQAAIYQKAIEHFKEMHPELNKYKLLPFKFLYIGRGELKPLKYTVTDKWINAAWNGFKTKSGYLKKGINDLVDEIIWHWSNKVYETTKEAYLNNGELILEDSSIDLIDADL